jgi:tRNA A-37 threonylcarbamoyl transferase component Bud32
MDRIGRYKIVRELGRGAMGVVYHAIDPNIGRPVAIKTIALGAVRKPEEQERMRERLFREARSAGILSHPGIVTIYDVEQQGDLAYIAMEYVDGPTLDQLLSEVATLRPEQIFGILGQTAVALDYAHQKGIVHRDIKPANIMIAADGTVKITDFGIAKITASEQFTMTGSIVGTPHYMSPEQVQGLTVDGRSDQFSLAVIAFEMLTGEKPYTGENLTTVVYKIVAEEPALPHRINPSLSREIGVVLQKGLSKKPDDRFRYCQEFTGALEKACAATKGWKPMPRGGSLNEPTAVDAARPAISLPPARKPLRSARPGETATTEVRAERKGGFLTFLLAMLVAAGLLALIGWQAFPWLSQKPQAQETAQQRQPKTETAPASQEPQPAQAPAAAGAAAPGEQKPSPMPPAEPPKEQPKAEEPKAQEPKVEEPKVEAAKPEVPKAEAPKPEVLKTTPKTEPAETPARTRQAPAPPPEPQRVSVISSPGAATATLDGRPETACTTPCSLYALPGRHTVAITMPGYGIEHREVFVGTYPLEMQAVVLHPIGGSLMLTSDPPGASVLVDGKSTGQVTPTELKLRPGSYRITIEKDGRQATQTVEIRTGISYLKILLGQ